MLGDGTQHQAVTPGEETAGEVNDDAVTATANEGLLEGTQKEGITVEEIMADEAAGEEQAAGEKVPGTPRGVQKRIDKVTSKLKLAENRAEVAERKAAELEAMQSAPTERPKAPLREDCETGEEYQAAMDKYQDDIVAYNNAQSSVKTKADSISNALQAGVDRFVEGSEKMREKFPDFDEIVTNRDNPFGIFRDLMLNSSNPAEVAYYYAKNPVEFEKLEQLGERQALLEIGALSAKFKTKPKKTTNAPPPLDVIKNGQEAAGAKSIYDIKDNSEFLKERNKRIRAGAT